MVLLSIVFIFLPKLNVIDIAGSGIRIDDFFLLAVILLITLLSLLKISHFNMILSDPVFRIVFYLFLLSCFSFLINLNDMKMANILYCVRLIEYSAFIYIGYYFYKFNINIYKIVLYYGLLSIGIIYLQHFNLFGGFVLGEYQSSVSGRPIGLTAGPWEVAMLLNIFIIFIQIYIKSNVKYMYLLIAFSAILLTGSRIALLSSVLILVISYWRVLFKSPIKFTLFSIFAGIFIVLSFNSTVYERSRALFTFDNIEYAKDFYSQIKPSDNVDLNKLSRQVNYNDTERDVSWMLRVRKWIYLFKNNMQSYKTIFFGHGPGYYGPAVDGSFVRVFGEIGLLGLFLYFMMLKKIMINDVLFYITIALCINMLFIDIIFSYKTMTFVFFIYGYYYNLLKQRHVQFFNNKTNI